MLRNPRAADDDVVVVENCGLAWGDGALRLIEGDEDFVVTDLLEHAWSGFMAVTNFHGDAQGGAYIVHRDQVHAAGAKRPRIKMFIAADDHLLVGSVNLN